MLTVVMFYVLVMVTAVMLQILVNSHVNSCTLSGTDDQPCGISVLVISHVMFQVLVIWLSSAGSCGCLC